jgi:hypothetical protein
MNIIHAAMASALAFACACANADVVTYRFTGTLTYAAYMAPAGAPITGTFSYDTQAPRTSEALPYYAHYQLAEQFTMQAEVGPHRIEAGHVAIDIINDTTPRTGVDNFVCVGVPVVDGTTYAKGSFTIALATRPGERFGLKGRHLPHALDLADFDTRYGAVGEVRSDGSQTGAILQFTIDDLQEVQRVH